MCHDFTINDSEGITPNNVPLLLINIKDLQIIYKCPNWKKILKLNLLYHSIIIFIKYV